MASGSITLTSSNPNYYSGRIDWVSRTNTVENYSIVDANVYVILNRWGIQGTGAGQFKENGTTTQNFSPYVNVEKYGSGVVLVFKREGIRVNHDSNGNGSIKLGCDMQFSFAGIDNIGGSQTIYMDHIDRYLAITNFSIKENYMNKVKFSWTVDRPADIAQAEYILSDGYTETHSIAYSDFVVPQNLDFRANTTYTIKLRVQRSGNNLWTEKTLQFKTEDCSRITKIEDMIAGATQDITIEKNGGEPISIELKIRNRNTDNFESIYSETFINPLFYEEEEIVTYPLDTEICLSDIYYYGWSNAIDAKLILKSGEDPVETDEVDFKILITDANPIVNNFNFKEGNSVCQNLTGGSKFIKGYSNIILLSNGLDIEFQKNEALDSEFCKKIRFECGSKYREFGYNATQGVTDVATLEKVDGNGVTLKVFDARNNEGYLTKNIDLIEYEDIKINEVVVNRVDGVSSNCKYSFSGKFYATNFGNYSNGIQSARYRKIINGIASSWTTISVSSITVNTDGTFSLSNRNVTGMTAGSECQFALEIKDRLSTATYVYTLNSGEPLVSFNKTKKWVGIGMIPTTGTHPNNSVMVDGDIVTDWGTVKGASGQFDDLYYQGNEFVSYMLNKIYPVGAVYISVNSTSPATLFGGTWVQIAQGRTLVGINTSDTDFNTVEQTGGEKTHTLTESEMPKHRHYTPAIGNTGSAGWTSTSRWSASAGGESIATNYTGSGNAHNNLQPYLVVYMWKRTA